MQKNFYKKLNKNIGFKFLLGILFLLLSIPDSSSASIIDTIKEKIQNKSEDIKRVEAEIQKYQNNLTATQTEKKSLQSEINSLTTTKKKIEGDLNVTEKNISKTTSNILTLAEEIKNREDSIENLGRSLASSFRNVREEDSKSPIEIILSSEQGLGEYGEFLETSNILNGAIRDKTNELKIAKEELEDRKNLAEGKKKELSKLKTELSGQKASVTETENQKSKLLKETANKETEYQKMLAEKIRLRDEFAKELFQFESELKIAIDPSKLPDAKGNVLAWPLANVFITQNFGATVAAKRLYVSGSHNGIDLRASDGTKVMAALSGTIEATGNTDAIKGCYSYGKWVLIKHLNGLSTLYAHLSSVTVKKGDTVSTGDTIAYSGRTGYVTGPHLHFTVVASEGAKVMAIPAIKSKSCGGAIIPIADPSAFLDPLLYLSKK